MSEFETKNSNNPKSSNNPLGPFFDLLILLAKGLRNQTFIFVLAMGTLIILAYWFSQQVKSFMPLYVVVGSLVVITLTALLVESISKKKFSRESLQIYFGVNPPNTSNNKRKSSRIAGKNPMPQFDKLRDWLDKLVDIEFRDMMNSLLTPKEITRLPRPLEVIDRGAFLGQMKIYERLDEVEDYLRQKYPERFAAK